MSDPELAEPLVSDSEPYTKGEKQPSACRDPIFAFLFYAHVGVMLFLSIAWGIPAAEETVSENSNTTSYNYNGIFYIAMTASLASFIISMLSLGIMMQCAQCLIQFALLFSICCSLAVVVLCAMSGQIGAAVFGSVIFVMGCCYAYMVWSRIPFATANLKTGLRAVKSNWGVVLDAFLLVGVAVLYTAIWSLAVMGVYDKTTVCDDQSGVCTSNLNGGYVFLLFLAFFWTEQVIQNTLQVTVAGVVGTWWFDPSAASSCCSPATTQSLCRATTLSFGSICFGSLLVAIIKALRQLIYSAKNNDDMSPFLLCILDCILSCIEGLLQYFNKWAFIYVGLYGYSYMEAGKNVMRLFEAKGFTTIITDQLIDNALSLVVLVIGGLTGVVGLIMNEAFPKWLEDIDYAPGYAFLIAFIVGLVISSIVISVVDSAVDTVLVCFAEGPAELEQNHPESSEQMRDAWSEAYPECCPW